MKLNLGAADRHIQDYLCVDIAPPPCAVCDAGVWKSNVRRVDLCDLWPWGDSDVDEVMALDVAEHIGNGYRLKKKFDTVQTGGGYARVLVDVELVPFNGRVHFFHELHRVLKPGGRCTLDVPNAAKGVGYHQDLTHSSQFCLSSFKYLEDGGFAFGRLGIPYGLHGGFKVLSLTESRSNGEDVREEVWKIRAVLEAVK